MVRITAADRIALVFNDLIIKWYAVLPVDVYPDRFKTVVRVIFVGVKAVQYYRFAFSCRNVFSVLNESKSAVYDMCDQQAVVIFPYQVIVFYAKEMTRAYGVIV